jgi:DNA (cytosine-5)-methyltransferase 1
VLNAKDFGVPQNRERIYIVAFRDAIDSNWFEFPVGTGLYKKVWDILEPADQVDPKHTLSSSLMDYYGPKIRKKAFGATVIDENTSYTHTLLATYYKNYQMILVGLGGWHLPNYHPRTRKLTPLECARLQGYDDFVFDKSVSDMQLYKQFGNSVAVPVIRAIAGKIREALFNGSWKI